MFINPITMKMNSFRNAKASPKQYNTPTFNICNLESIFIMSKKTKPKNMTKKIIWITFLRKDHSWYKVLMAKRNIQKL
jgi:hypothetical protein